MLSDLIEAAMKRVDYVERAGDQQMQEILVYYIYIYLH